METIEERIEKLKKSLSDQVGCSLKDVKVAISPLRVAPLGAHVDHQLGLVTGMTIDKSILLAFVPRDDDKVIIDSLNFPGTVDFSVNKIPAMNGKEWGNYVKGAALAIEQKHNLKRGMNALIEGNMPIGGLSSSAATGVACLLAIEECNGLNISAKENIHLDRYIENEYLGLKNGILDQSIILLSQKDQLTYMDCRSEEFENIPCGFKKPYDVVVVYSGLSKALTGTDYNNRVYECREGARRLMELADMEVPETPKLRMVPREVWLAHKDELPDPIDRRVKHFFTEVQRVRDGVAAWKTGDLENFGKLIMESGESSVNDYESGSPHLKTVFDILKETQGVYGARFSGAGFRGSCIGITDPDHREEIVERIKDLYPKQHPDVSELYSVHFCQPDDGARIV